MAKSTRIRKSRNLEQELAKLIGLPEAQLRRGFSVVQVANRTEADQRHSIRSKETRTLRKLTRIEKLHRAHIITAEEADACEWYANAYSLGFDTVGITANYEGAGGRGDAGHTHLARNKAQMAARQDYAYARAGISPLLVPLLERVLLHGRPIGRLGISFRTAVRQLRERVVGEMRIAA